MSRFTLSLSAVALAAVAAGCDTPSSPTMPLRSASSPQLDRDGHDRGPATRTFTLMDACDPTTFDAVLGAGACARSGGVTFTNFIGELQQMGIAPQWRIDPTQTDVAEGTILMATNRGGEDHTFTRVRTFGGGIVPILNTLSHNTTVASECLDLHPDDFVAPGQTYTADDPADGTSNYQCCIHPWMRTVVHTHHS